MRRIFLSFMAAVACFGISGGVIVAVAFAIYVGPWAMAAMAAATVALASFIYHMEVF